MKKSLFIPGLICMLALAAEAQSITVHAPNGGEELITGKVFDIAWIAQGTTKPFKITLWKNGTLVGVIRAAEPAGNGNRSICWTVGHLESGGPAGSGEGYTIKIKEKDKPVSDTSDQPFNISMAIATVQMQATMSLRPDLKVSIIPTPPSPGVGEKTAVRFRVDNIGKGTTPATTLQVSMGAKVTDTWPVFSLAPGRHFSMDKKLNPAGVGYILWSAQVDPDNIILDVDPSNNSATYKMIVRGPDLKITRVYTPDYKRTIQAECKIYVTVENVGSVNAGRFEIDCDWKFCKGIARGRKYKIHEGPLKPGESVTFTFKHRYACFGMKYPTLHVNKSKDLKEENYNNNSCGAVFHISGENIGTHKDPRESYCGN